MNKNIWVIANWKSNKNIQEALEWVSIVGPKIPRAENLKVVVCPTFVALEEVKKAVQVGNFPILVGSQDLSPFETGAHTGDEAASLLKSLVNIAILGHSERRQQGETDEQVAEKVVQANNNQITPLVCVQDKDTPVPANCYLVAYEPVFAIGTGTPDTPQNANEVAVALKAKDVEIQVLYGGSVTSQNAKAFLQQDNISGVLVGKASLDAEEFVRIVDECYALQ